jgi:hypothetical protein
MRKRRLFFNRKFLKGYRSCTGQYNGGLPCLGSSIEYSTCATNVTCPSMYFNNNSR